MNITPILNLAVNNGSNRPTLPRRLRSKCTSKSLAPLFVVALIFSIQTYDCKSTQIDSTDEEKGTFVCTINATTNISNIFNFRISEGILVDLSSDPRVESIVPSMCSLQMRETREHRCGAVFIEKPSGSLYDVVLTAAHCFFTKFNESNPDGSIQIFFHPVPWKQFVLLCGSTDRNSKDILVDIINVILYVDYNPTHIKNDIALVHVKLPANAKVCPLPISPITSCDELSGSIDIYGWGDIRESSQKGSRGLRTVNLPVWSKCPLEKGQFMAGFAQGTSGHIPDACQGDSGGPALQNGSLVGLIIGGIGCGRANCPGYYTLVGFNKPWLDKQIIRWVNLERDPQTKKIFLLIVSFTALNWLLQLYGWWNQ